MIPFRDRIHEIARAPWFQKTWLYRLLYVFGVHCDALIESAVLAVKARFPTFAPSDALPALGRERGIRRGFAETDAQYRARLIRWLRTRRIKGGPWALMDQLAGYLTGYSCKIRVVNSAGAWCTRNADGSREYYIASPTNWDLGGRSDYFVIVYLDQGPWDPQTTWGATGLKWGADGLTWGTTATPEQVRTCKAIIQEMNPPHAKCRWLVFAMDPDSFSPTGSGAGYPDSTWVYWKNRLATARYVEVTAA